jgi:uncharacterized protein
MSTQNQSKVARPRKIWIDLDNTPHVPLLAPIMEELERRGYRLIVTARDCFQVCALADSFHLRYRSIGRHYGKHIVLKAFGTIYRGLQLLPIALWEKPDLAVSHGSRAQLIAAAISRVPSVMMEDYEFGKNLPGLTPTWVMVPEVMRNTSFRTPGKILKYPGIKEDVYVPAFKPDPGIRSELGFDESNLVVTLRPPATEAHYRSSESDVLFNAAVDLLQQTPDVKIIVLPRNAHQAASIRSSWPQLIAARTMLIPDRVVNGLNLIWHSDFVISGGGTMNREAAALGVPVYSVFRGPIGEVDNYLAETGRLVLLESVADVKTKVVLRRRDKAREADRATKQTLKTIVDHIVNMVEPSSAGVSAPVAIATNR